MSDGSGDDERSTRQDIDDVDDIDPHATVSASDTSEPDGVDSQEEPLSGLAKAVEERRQRREDDELDIEEFDEQEFTAIDSDQLWAELGDSGDEPIAVGDRVDDADETNGDVRVISDKICHRCRYFADPPAVHCTHSGTEILEMIDDDHFKVVDCPMVIDDVEELEDGFKFQLSGDDDN